MDGGFFLVMAAIPFKALAIGAGSLALGLLPAAHSVTYIVFTQLAGRWSDRLGRSGICLAGSLILVAATVLSYPVRDLALLLALMLAMGVGKALYWPAVHATVGELSGPDRLVRNTGLLNVSWSAGKSLGFLAGGTLLALSGFKLTFLVGAAVVAGAFWLLPRRLDVSVASAVPADRSRSATTAPAPERRLLRRMAWLGNIGAYGALGILSYHLPQYFEMLGWGESRFGIFLAGILLFQTLVFVLLIGTVRFAYSLSRLWVPQLMIAVAVALVPWLRSYAAFLAAIPLLGIGLGFCYAASMYYSLDTENGKGRNAGIHESLIGVGFFVPPLAGGVAAKYSGWLGAPYLLGAGCCLLLLLMQIVMWAAGRRQRAPAPPPQESKARPAIRKKHRP